MNYNNEWKDYEIIATGNGEKLERWGNVYLLRPDPQVIWPARYNLSNHKMLNASYNRHTTGGGAWNIKKQFPNEWIVGWRTLKFIVKPMGFKHTGLFPEQAYNWSKVIDIITTNKKKYENPIKILNLFAYTGAATVACASAGALVTHVDAAKGMVERAKQNISLSNLESAHTRFIVDDCKKFIEREIRRGNKYDAIIMDPPSYGRGPSGEVWKLEDCLYDFIILCRQVLSDKPLFVLINSYTTGLQPGVLENLSKIAFEKYDIGVEAYEIGLPTDEGITLPCGCSCFCTFNKI